MDTELKWIVTRVNGKISGVSLNYESLEFLLSRYITKMPSAKTDQICTCKVSTSELLDISRELRWEDLNLYGTPFQLHVWEELFKLNHTPGAQPKLLSYSEFATICGNRPGIRAVAHAVGLNPLAAIIPCHRIIPKESIDRIREIEDAAKKTIFQGDDLYLYDAIDFGNYALGKKMKRDLIEAELEAIRRH